MSMLRMDEQQYQDLLKKRAGYKAGGLVTTLAAIHTPPTIPVVLRGAKKKSSRTPNREVQRKQSGIEIMLAQQIHLLGLPAPVRNYRFMPGRKFELDFCWPEQRLGLEVQGMCHRIKDKWQRDIEKRALALLAGWRILEVGGKEIRSGQAGRWIEQLLGENKK